MCKRSKFLLDHCEKFHNGRLRVKDPAQHAFYKALGARIRELRGTKLSQEQLAKAAKLSRTSVVNIEAGRQKLLVFNLFRISAALKTRPTVLLASLEPSAAAIPDIDMSGAGADWVQRSVKKAIESRPRPK